MKSEFALPGFVARGCLVAGLLLAVAGVAPAGPPPQKKAPPKKPVATDKAARHKIIYPPGFKGGYKLTPVLYALHGYGGNREQMIAIWREPCAQLGIILIVGNGEGPLGEGSFKWGGPEDAGRLIDAARHELRKNVKLDPSAPRILSGFSQGGFATWSLALRYPTTYRRLIPCCGMYKSGTDQMIKPLSEVERFRMKRWRAYIMCGAKDGGDMVPNNNWIASQLADLGAAVRAPFNDPRDPSYALYQDLGHGFPGTDAASRNAELVRALKFVLRGDEKDEANWFKVDAKWQKQIWAGKAEENQQDETGRPEATSRPAKKKEQPAGVESPMRGAGMPGRIGEFQGEYRFLSNFWPAPCEFEGLRYPSSEHAYQAAKTLDLAERKRISALPTPSDAKKAGRALTLRLDWETVKFDVMRACVRSKFALNPDLAEKLLATGDALLEEGNTWGDRTWGVVDGVGENRLGKILMDVRTELREPLGRPKLHSSPVAKHEAALRETK